MAHSCNCGSCAKEESTKEFLASGTVHSSQSFFSRRGSPPAQIGTGAESGREGAKAAAVEGQVQCGIDVKRRWSERTLKRETEVWCPFLAGAAWHVTALAFFTATIADLLQ